MSGTPFFTVAIPSKNRPDRVRNAVRSVLEQSFADLEVIVCDNSDAGDEATQQALAEFDDPRLRVVRTDGTLSMPDNWERAVADARGEYVGILTDRSVFRRDALEVVRGEIESTGAKAVSWFNDLYGRDESGKTLKRRACTFRRHRLSSEQILDYFLRGDPKFSTKIVPKLMTAVFHRSILESARASPVGRVCPPVCPDFTSGFLMLTYTDWVLTLDEPLYVSCGYGTGSAFRRRSDLGDRFRHELGMTWTEMVDRMPSEACFSHALVLNDLMRLKDALPDRFPAWLEVNRAQYYLGCLNDYVKTARGGVKRGEDINILLAAFEREPAEVREQVQATRIYARSEEMFSPTKRSEAMEKLRAKIRDRVHAMKDVEGFGTVFDAMEWDRANPRVPAQESFLDVLQTVDDAKRKKKKAAVAAPELVKKPAQRSTPSPLRNWVWGLRSRE